MRKLSRILLMAAIIAVTAMYAIADVASYSWAGKWDTGEYGEMSLTQNGLAVTGSYKYSGGTIRGTVSGNTLTGTWKQTNNRKGKFRFVMSSDGKSFTGSYGYDNEEPTKHGGWNGKKG